MGEEQVDRAGAAFRVAALSQKKPTRFDYAPDAPARAAMAAILGLLDLPDLRMKGELRPSGRRDFVLEARLTATAIQPCSVTLAPVAAPIDEPVLRRYLADFSMPEGDEVEMPEDDSADPLPEVIDLGEVAAEALALALPLYPRAPGVDLGEAVFAEPGTQALRDGDLKPFAGLAGLAESLRNGNKDGR
ncbi:MAG: YceD family protein [Paracoccaceae bacterium]